MILLRDPAEIDQIDDPSIQALLRQRFQDIAADEPYDPELHGYFVVAENGDTPEMLEKECGGAITHNPCTELSFGQPGFTPVWECLEEHQTCFEMVFVLSDGGFGVVLIIPKQSGIDAELLHLCSVYATPSPDLF